MIPSSEQRTDTSNLLSGRAIRRLTPEVLSLVRRQHGVASRTQLFKLGLSHDRIDGMIAAGILLRLFRGVFAIGHDVLDSRGCLHAGVLVGGPAAAISHQSAAFLWGVLPAAREVEITRPSSPERQPQPARVDRHRPSVRLRIHRTRCLKAIDFTIHAGLPVTTFERTMLNLSSTLNTRNLEKALTEGERRGLVDRAALAKISCRGPGWKGIGKLREVLERWDPVSVLTKSDLEFMFLGLVAQAGLPVPGLNVHVGEIEVDCLWEKQKLIVELDAYSTHGDVFSFERDRIRDAYLKSGGFEVFRVTDRMLAGDTDRTMGLVKELFRSRSLAVKGEVPGSVLP
ncbi:MAG: type IV toxin-antitoxin system AbiEi family antitoxin domain-containing protein [Solirubrobacterales bacterium]